MKLQESNLSDLILHADNSKTVEDFLKKVEEEGLAGELSKEELVDFYNSGKNMNEVLPKSADAGEYIKDFEKSKAPQFKGKSKKKRREMAVAAFMAANKGKMKKEEILKAIKEVLAENKAYKVTSASGQTTTQSFASDAEANDFKSKNTNIRAVQQLEEDDWKDANDESSMAKSQLYHIASYAIELMKMIQDGEQLDAWVQSKITKAADYIDSVKHYMEGEKALAGSEEPMNEGRPSLEVGDKVKASKEYGGLAGEVVDIKGSFVVVKTKKGNKSYHESDLNKEIKENLDAKYTPSEDYKYVVKSKSVVGLKGREDKMYFRTEEAAKAYVADGKPGMRKYLGVEDEIEEGNLGHNELASLEQQGGSWIVTYRTMDGKKTKVFTDEDKARAFMNTTLKEAKKKLDPVGHEDEDVDNDGKKNTKTDKYLKNRRVKIGQAIASHKK